MRSKLILGDQVMYELDRRILGLYWASKRVTLKLILFDLID
jgi:hypothetical protein